MFDAMYRAFGWLLMFCYDLVDSYGLAILLFTVITKAVLFPLGIPQQRSSSRKAKVYPQEIAIQNRYGGPGNLRNLDQTAQQKYYAELQAMYKANKVNQLAGCLPTLLQFPLIIALYRAIYRPITYMLGFNIENFMSILGEGTTLKIAQGKELQIISEVQKLGTEAAAALPNAAAEEISRLQDLNFNFLGMDLTQIIGTNFFQLLIIIPVLSGATTYLYQFLMKKFNPMPPVLTEDDPSKGMNSFMKFMPLMSVVFAFMLPSGLGLYWIFSNLAMILQSFILSRMYPVHYPTREEALAMVKVNKQRRPASPKVKKAPLNTADGTRRRSRSTDPDEDDE